jgi:hypothetical protein
MSIITIIGAALFSGLAALGLTRWMRQVAEVESRWLASGLHIAVAAVAGAGAAALADNWAELIGYTLLGLGCALLVSIDLAALRLPNVIVGPLYIVVTVALAVAAGVNGEPLRLARAAGAAALLILLYFVLAFIRPSGMGLPTIKELIMTVRETTLPETDPDAVRGPRKINFHIVAFVLIVIALIGAGWYFISPETFPGTAEHTVMTAQDVSAAAAKSAWDGQPTEQQEQICDLYNDDSALALDVVKGGIGHNDPDLMIAFEGLLDRTC